MFPSPYLPAHFRRSLLTGLCCYSLTSVAFAQDWVSVYEEPKHRPVFENEQVLILDVNLPPGYVSLYHEHRLDTLYVTLSGTQVYAQPLGGEQRHADVKTGDLRFSSDNHDLPHIHRVGNVGEAPFHIIGVGIKTEGSNTESPIEGDMQGLERVDEKPHAFVYRIRLEPDEKSGVHTHKLPFTRVYLTGGSVLDGAGEAAQVKAGAFLWQEGGVTHRHENTGDTPIEVVEVQAR
jgi:quercetin dioxygenase-like cupin family protein